MTSNQNYLETSDIRLDFTEDFVMELSKLSRNARIVLLSWMHRNLSHQATIPNNPAKVTVDNKTYYKFVFSHYSMFLTKLTENHYRVDLLSVSPRKERFRYKDGWY